MKKLGLIQLLALAVVCVCATVCEASSEPAAKPDTRQTAEPAVAFSFEDAAITLPPPASVHLDPEGRLGKRFQANINYVRYLHDGKLDGKDLLEAYATRHYAPGKLLEFAWDREYAGKWLDAATRIAVNTGNNVQLTRVDAFAASLRRYQQPDGYMGVKLPTDRHLDSWEQEWDLWNQWYALTGLLTHYEFRGDSASLEAASRVGKWIVKTYGPIENENARFFEGEIVGGLCNVVVIGQLVRLYRYTGNENLLEFVRKVIRYYPPIQRMRSSGEPVLVQPYHLDAILGGVAEFADVTRDHETLAWVEKVWQRLASNHLYPTGSLGMEEGLSKKPPKDRADGQLQETCSTVEWLFFTQRLYEITGRSKYVEALENTIYNALLAAQSRDGMRWCYYTPLCYHKDWFHGATKCCYFSGPRGIARLPQLIYSVKDETIYVNFFETSHATIATRNGKVDVTQDSKLPEIGQSRVTLKTPPGWKGTLRIRKPHWINKVQIKLNGKLVPSISDVKGYCDVKLQESREHQVEIRFNIPFKLEKFADGYLLRRGPEVLSVDACDNIQTWLRAKPYNLISFPEKVTPQPIASDGTRRRYRAYLNDKRTSELRSLIFTPYADAGNEGTPFRTVFPRM